MQLSGVVTDRFGGARVMVPAAALDAATLLAPALAPDLPVLVVALFVFGVVQAR